MNCSWVLWSRDWYFDSAENLIDYIFLWFYWKNPVCSVEVYRLPPENNHNFGRINPSHFISHLTAYEYDSSFKKWREEYFVSL